MAGSPRPVWIVQPEAQQQAGPILPGSYADAWLTPAPKAAQEGSYAHYWTAPAETPIRGSYAEAAGLVPTGTARPAVLPRSFDVDAALKRSEELRRATEEYIRRVSGGG
jgi:hypothetical protein